MGCDRKTCPQRSIVQSISWLAVRSSSSGVRTCRIYPSPSPRRIVIGTLFTTAFAFNSVAVLGAVIGIAAHVYVRERGGPVHQCDRAAVGGTWITATLVAVAVAGLSSWLLVLMAVTAGGLCSPRLRWWRAHLPGTLFIVVSALSMLVGAAWSVRYVATVEVSTLTRILLGTLCVLGIVVLPSTASTGYRAMQVLLRDDWRRPSVPVAPQMPSGGQVSIHLPCHCEPPGVVIATLDSLARLAYDDFEVVVVDNNTDDDRLWRPVAEHCARLGARFHFHHVTGLSGAKAGALNFALAHTSAEAQFIALVDADYRMEPNFLADLLGHFTDPAVAFVQCSYDFHNWAGNRFLTGCHWEYLFGFRTIFRSASEFGVGFPAGTSCILRRRAVETVGGWAHWALTEDSEISIRLHAAGYTGYMLRTSYGKGLVPETFAAYKKQRYRWTYGPVQAFKRHWRLYLPTRWGGARGLSGFQKTLYMTFALDIAAELLAAAAVPLQLIVLATMIVRAEQPPVPSQLWLVLALGASASLAMRWCVWRYHVRASRRETILAMLSSAALGWIRTVGVVSGIFTHHRPWQRTDKFDTASSWQRGFAATHVEAIIATSMLAVAGTAFTCAHHGLLIVIELGVAATGLRYLAAPLASLLSEYELQRRRPTRR
ncbi:glycosyltransferase family 2 protein [Nocardia sp. CA-128927]|uniref:glycosyltransferase family 2 protein n=1 Tax=Nocardia sp. CA-128927 TaxID=3239975 RepID=UPI003D98D48D